MRNIFLLVIPVAVYLYFYFLRIIKYLTSHMTSEKKYAVSAAVTVVCIFLAVKFRMGGMCVLLILVMSFVITDIINLIMRMILKKDKARKKWTELHGGGLCAVLVVALMLLYGYYNANHVIVRNYNIQNNSISGNMKIGLISDIHMGTSVKDDEIEKYCAAVQKNKPDLLVICGDIADEGTTSAQLTKLIKAIGNIKTSLGTYFVYGANDGLYDKDIDMELAKNGIKVLDDEIALIDNSFYIVGRMAEGSKNRMSVEELVKDVDKPIILINHEQSEIDEELKGKMALQLAGETHGGQIQPIGWIYGMFSKKLMRGIREEDNYTLAVTSGMGCRAVPIRTAGRSEIVMLEIN